MIPDNLLEDFPKLLHEIYFSKTEHSLKFKKKKVVIVLRNKEREVITE